MVDSPCVPSLRLDFRGGRRVPDGQVPMRLHPLLPSACSAPLGVAAVLPALRSGAKRTAEFCSVRTRPYCAQGAVRFEGTCDLERH